MYVYIHIYISIYIYMYLFIYIYIYMYLYIYIFIYIQFVYLCTHKCSLVSRRLRCRRLVGSQIADFGLSALGDTHDENGQMNTVCGTPDYIAPEVCARARATPDSSASNWVRQLESLTT